MSMLKTYNKLLIESYLKEDNGLSDEEKLMQLVKTGDKDNVSLAFNMASGLGIDLKALTEKYIERLFNTGRFVNVTKAEDIMDAMGDYSFFEKYINTPYYKKYSEVYGTSYDVNDKDDRDAIAINIIWQKENKDRIGDFTVFNNYEISHPFYMVFNHKNGRHYTIYDSAQRISSNYVLKILSFWYPEIKSVSGLKKVPVEFSDNAYTDGSVYWFFTDNTVYTVKKGDGTPKVIAWLSDEGIYVE